MNAYTYDHFVFDKGAKTMKWKKDNMFKKLWFKKSAYRRINYVNKLPGGVQMIILFDADKNFKKNQYFFMLEVLGNIRNSTPIH